MSEIRPGPSAGRTTAPPLPTGSIPALVTPMVENGAIDWSSFGRLIDWHIGAGSDALVIMGSTGESETVSMAEHRDIIASAIELARAAREAGAIAPLSVVPYYNKPTQEGLYQHFRAVAEAAEIPVILYNVPGRTITDLAIETVLRLAEIPNIVGLKDATGDIGRGVMLMAALPEHFHVYSGDDPTAAALMLLGASGNISVTANIIPAAMARLCAAARSGDIETVREISRRIAPLHQAMFVESNPIPVKWALARLGMIEAHYRLPLTSLSPAWHDHVDGALHAVLASLPDKAPIGPRI